MSAFKRKLFFSVTSVGLPLIIGALLYYILCPDVIFVSCINALLGIKRLDSVGWASLPAGTFIRNYLFDFLWAFALANALYILSGDSRYYVAVCLLMPPVLGATLEIMQLIDIAQGTFDLTDVAVEVAGAAAAVLIIKIRRRKWGKLQNL